MEGSRVEKRTMEESAGKELEPILVRVDKHGCAPCDIRIDKNEFKIGRGRDNDEIILDTMISRRHCILRCEGNGEWMIKDLSSTSTFLNNVPLKSETNYKISVGDIIQFSTCSDFKYMFTFAQTEEHNVKKPKLEEKVLHTVLTQQKTFVENQECQQKELRDRLQNKQKEQAMLNEQLQELLNKGNMISQESLQKQISTLQNQIETCHVQEKHLQTMYFELLKNLEKERIQFEVRLNEEKQKWQEALDLSKQEKKMVEETMKKEMKKWQEKQQEEWKNLMENRVQEEKEKQTELLNEKHMLEKKLKETENALKKKDVKALPQIPQVSKNEADIEKDCICLDNPKSNSPQCRILDTIDLTESTQFDIGIKENSSKENIIHKVTNIMDEQLTCSICSELFLGATTLNCMHTFCSYCIRCWSKKQKQCPICRAPIKAMNQSLVLDNFIESMLENLPADVRDKRNQLIQERKGVQKKKKCS